MRKETLDSDVTIADGLAIIQPRSGRMIRAKVLGTRRVGSELHHYLDRLIHPQWVNHVGRYRAEGAVSTILIEEA
jgi:hypothetical protein